MRTLFDQLVESYVDAFGDPKEILDLRLVSGDVYGLFVSSYEEIDGLATNLIFTVGINNWLQNEARDQIELSFHSRASAGLSQSEIVESIASFVDRLVARGRQVHTNEILADSAIVPNADAVLVVNDHIFEAIAYEPENQGFDIPIFRLLPLHADETASLSGMPQKVRGLVALQVDPMLSGVLKRVRRYTVGNAMSDLWREILAWHQQHATQLWSVAESTKSTPPLFDGLEALIGAPLPPDLKESWRIQNRRFYLTDYEYMDVEGVEYMVAPNADLDWDRKLIPFAEDSGGNMICVDMNEGKDCQVVLFEVEEGVLRTGLYSFFHWLWRYKEDLLGGKYLVDSEGFLEER